MTVTIVVLAFLCGACTGPETGLLSCEETGVYAPSCIQNEHGATICVSHPVCKDGTGVRASLLEQYNSGNQA